MRGQCGDERGILPQVINNSATGKKIGLDGGQRLGGNNGRGGVGLAPKDAPGTVGDHRSHPAGGVETGLIPACSQQPRIVGLTAIDMGISDGAGRRLPLGVARDDLGHAVGVIEMYLRDHFGRTERAGKLAVIRGCQDIVHPVAQHHPHGIVAIGQIRCEIQCVVEAGLVILAPARGKPGIAHFKPVG